MRSAFCVRDGMRKLISLGIAKHAKAPILAALDMIIALIIGQGGGDVNVLTRVRPLPLDDVTVADRDSRAPYGSQIETPLHGVCIHHYRDQREL